MQRSWGIQRVRLTEIQVEVLALALVSRGSGQAALQAATHSWGAAAERGAGRAAHSAQDSFAISRARGRLFVMRVLA